VVEEERKKRGFDSQLVVQKLRLTKDKDLVVRAEDQPQVRHADKLATKKTQIKQP